MNIMCRGLELMIVDPSSPRLYFPCMAAAHQTVYRDALSYLRSSE